MKSATQKALLAEIADRNQWIEGNQEGINAMTSRIAELVKANREHKQAVKEMQGDLESLGLAE